MSVRSWPATRITPSVASISLISSRITVDLPEPVAPTRNTNSPRPTANVAWSSPVSPLVYRLDTPRNSITGGQAEGGRTGRLARAGATGAEPRATDLRV